MTQGTAAIIAQMAGTESEPAPAWLLGHLCDTDPAAFAGAYEAFATAPPNAEETAQRAPSPPKASASTAARI
jgi:hypothetical protein